MNILYVSADNPKEYNCAHWRCYMPAEVINKTGEHAARVVDIQAWATGQNAEDCFWSDVVVIQRNVFLPQVQAMLTTLREAGKIVICDFDDAYDLMPRTNVAWNAWRSNPEVLDEFEHGLTLCHAATMPSAVLMDDWEQVTPTYLVPNYMPCADFNDITRYPHDGVWIGWGGSMSHRQSWMNSGLMAACRRVAQAWPDVQFHIHSADEIIYQLLPVPKAQKILLPWMPYADWVGQLSQFDVGLAPLWGPYDDRRSWIKPMEYMLAGVPCVASDNRAYAELVENNMIYQTPNTAGAWADTILYVLERRPEQERRLSRAADFAQMQDIERNVAKIIEVYQMIMERAR